jgi:hypothetical protein
MKIYRIANVGIFYRGSPSPEISPAPRDFPGVFFTSDLNDAQNWGRYISKYSIPTENIYSPNTININIKDYNTLKDFISIYGYRPRNVSKKWSDMGAAKRTITELNESNFWDVMGQVLLFPTKEWVDYLKGLGYNGFSNDKYLFLFDANNAKYIKQEDL